MSQPPCFTTNRALSDLDRTKATMNRASSDLDRTKATTNRASSDLDRTKATTNRASSDLDLTKATTNRASSDLDRTKATMNRASSDLDRTKFSVHYQTQLYKEEGARVRYAISLALATRCISTAQIIMVPIVNFADVSCAYFFRQLRRQ